MNLLKTHVKLIVPRDSDSFAAYLATKLGHQTGELSALRR